MPTATWFENALSPDVVAARLRRDLAEFRGGSTLLVGCRITRIRSVPPEGAWTAIYELEVRNLEAASRTVVARGRLVPPGTALPAGPADGLSLDSEGWTCVLPELRLVLEVLALDESLPGLALLLDQDEGARLLEGVLRRADMLPADTEVSGYVPSVASHKPGVRATVLCRLGYAGSAPRAPGALIVKVHSGDQGEHGHEVLTSLMGSTPSGRGARTPRPVAYLPELRLSVQEHIAHEMSLKDLFHSVFDEGREAEGGSARLDATVAAAGAGLAWLHCSASTGDVVGSWEADLASVTAKYHKLLSALPHLGGPLGSALERIAMAGERIPADASCLCHGSFHPAEVLLTDAGVAFLDFDKSGQAEPASDVGAFTTKLRHMAVNKVDSHEYDARGVRESAVEALRTRFLDEYRRIAPLSEGRLAAWEALELFALVLSAAKKALAPRSDNCLKMLDHHLSTHGI